MSLPLRTGIGLAIGLALTLAFLLATRPSSAQEPAATISAGSDVRSIGERYFGGHVDVYADGTLCGRLSFTDTAQATADGGAAFELASAGQAPACSESGATISFFDGNNVALANRYELVPGQGIEMEWLNVGPIRVAEGSTPTGDGSTVLVADEELSGSNAASILGWLDVYADDQLCGRLSFSDASQREDDGSVQLRLAEAAQPASCAEEGAALTLYTSSGVRLSAVYRLDVGNAITVQNFTVPPPGSGDTGTTVPEAPDTGSGVLDAPSGGTSNALLGLATVAVLLGVLGGIVLGAARRRGQA